MEKKQRSKKKRVFLGDISICHRLPPCLTLFSGMGFTAGSQENIFNLLELSQYSDLARKEVNDILNSGRSLPSPTPPA